MDKIYTCPECGKKFEGISAFSNHINEEKTKFEEIKKANELQARITSLKSDMKKYIDKLRNLMAEFNSLSKEEKAVLNFGYNTVSVNKKSEPKTEKTKDTEQTYTSFLEDVINEYIGYLGKF